MNSLSQTDTDRDQIRQLLEDWARASRKDSTDEAHANRTADLVIHNALQDLSIVTRADVAMAHCSVQRGGTRPGGKAIENMVRATFCLEKIDGSWQVVHQQLSKPFQSGGWPVG